MNGETKAERRARQLAAVRAAWGILKPRPGEASSASEIANWKAEERAIEQRHEDFLMSIGSGKPLVIADVLAKMRRVKRKTPRR